MNLEKIIDKLIKVDEKGNLYVVKNDLDRLNLTESDRLNLVYLLKTKKIRIKDIIIENARSKFVCDYDYGEQLSVGNNHLDMPTTAKLSFSDSGELIGEDYHDFENFIEDFIANYVIMKKHINKITGEITIFPSIQLTFITKLRISELEQKYLIEYLDKKGIRVSGHSESLEDEFENYDYCRTYKSSILPRPLTEFEEYTYFSIFEEDKKNKKKNESAARKKLILHNMRLVPYLAWKYAFTYDIPIEQLESYGYEGLLKAIDKFDVDLGYRFSTYAISVINNYIKRGCQVIIAGNHDAFAVSYIKIKRMLEKKYGTTLVESPELIEEIVDLLLHKNIHIQNRELVKRKINLLNMFSLEGLEDLLVTDEDEIISLVSSNIIKERIEFIFNTLTPAEQEVIKFRFGLFGEKKHTIDEIIKKLNCSRGIIRRLGDKGLRKFKSPQGKLASLVDCDISFRK